MSTTATMLTIRMSSSISRHAVAAPAAIGTISIPSGAWALVVWDGIEDAIVIEDTPLSEVTAVVLMTLAV